MGVSLENLRPAMNELNILRSPNYARRLTVTRGGVHGERDHSEIPGNLGSGGG